MKLNHGLHLCYSTNVHRGESWNETLAALDQHTMAVRREVCPDQPYAIGLRLSDLASRELSEPSTLAAFQRWLERRNCYVFTINGFPFGQFHGTRVKEQVYVPDWTSPQRLEYTNRLFDLLSVLVPPSIEGSVSTSPCSFKEFNVTASQWAQIRQNLWRCVEHIAAVSKRSGRELHLGLEPEPLCSLETSAETVEFIDSMQHERPSDERLKRHLGVNYDTCHLAIEYEDATEALRRFAEHGVKVSKLHFSSALKVRPTLETRHALRAFADDTYLHQVITRNSGGAIRRHRDLDVALQAAETGSPPTPDEEWRIHFHVPLHCPATAQFGNTTDHLLQVMDALKSNPGLCSHLEMETYTWEVMPPELKGRTVVEQLVAEYRWCLGELRDRGLA